MQSLSSPGARSVKAPDPESIPTREQVEAAEARRDAILAKIGRGEPITTRDGMALIWTGVLTERYVNYLKQAERDLVRLENRRLGKQARADRGAYVGGNMPYGFTWDETSQEWHTVEGEHRVLIEIKRLRDAGRGYHAIAEELNRRGIPTAKGGAKWRGPSVERILKNEFYERILGW
jgi:hypothetical protein